MCSDFTWEKIFAPWKWGGRACDPPASLSLRPCLWVWNTYSLFFLWRINKDQSFNPIRLRRSGSDPKTLSVNVNSSCKLSFKFIFYKDSWKYGKLVFRILTPILILILMVPEAAKLQFILQPFFERLVKIPSSKQNSFAHETLLVKKLIYD